jgi:hypothetical protein
MLLTVETLHRALGGTITRADGRRQVLCPGPGHSAADRSLAVSPSSCEDGFVVYSHAGDDPIVCKDYVRERMGMEPFRPGGNNGYSDGKNRANNFGLKIGNADRKLIATHSYTDDAGAELFQVLRYESKGFSQRRPDGNGGWIYNLDGVRRVLYRLPELIEQVAMGHPAFISEGEKDVDVLWAIGVPATCNPHGAGKWLPEYNQHLHGAKSTLFQTMTS